MIVGGWNAPVGEEARSERAEDGLALGLLDAGEVPEADDAVRAEGGEDRLKRATRLAGREEEGVRGRGERRGCVCGVRRSDAARTESLATARTWTVSAWPMSSTRVAPDSRLKPRMSDLGVEREREREDRTHRERVVLPVPAWTTKCTPSSAQGWANKTRTEQRRGRPRSHGGGRGRAAGLRRARRPSGATVWSPRQGGATRAPGPRAPRRTRRARRPRRERGTQRGRRGRRRRT